MTINPASNANTAMNMLNPLEESARASSRVSESASAKSVSASGSASGKADAAQVNDRTTFSSKFWNPQESVDFSMETYTRNGTRIQVEAGERSFTMGHFANKGPFQNNFNLAGARAPLDISVTFTTTDGKVATHKLTESSVFHETEDGTIVEGRGRGKSVSDPNDPAKKIDENNIIFNMDDKGSAIGGTGDDVLLNFGSEAWVNGQEGNDTIVNMGDKATIKGGEGNDLIKVVRDVIRETKNSTVDLDKVSFDGLPLPAVGGKKTVGQVSDLYAPALVGQEGGAEVNVDAGDGNDVIDSRDAKLENATIDGGSDDDLMLMDTLVGSKVKGGDGNDEIHADNMLQTTIEGGEGDDTINVKRMKQSTVNGGSGDDTLSVDHMVESHVQGEAGNDSINVNRALRSTISGGQGDDTITVNKADGTTISGDQGNDTISVKSLLDSTVDGGEGDDQITVGDMISASKESTVMGGTGNDTIQVGSTDGNVKISGGTSDDDNDSIVMGEPHGLPSWGMQAGVKAYTSTQERIS